MLHTTGKVSYNWNLSPSLMFDGGLFTVARRAVLECMLTKPELQTLSFFDMTKFKPGKIPTNLRSGHLQYLLQHSMTYLMLHTPLIQQTWEPLSHSSTLKCKSMS